jgi:hypothetical protein
MKRGEDWNGRKPSRAAMAGPFQPPPRGLPIPNGFHAAPLVIPYRGPYGSFQLGGLLPRCGSAFGREQPAHHSAPPVPLLIWWQPRQSGDGSGRGNMTTEFAVQWAIGALYGAIIIGPIVYISFRGIAK